MRHRINIVNQMCTIQKLKGLVVWLKKVDFQIQNWLTNDVLGHLNLSRGTLISPLSTNGRQFVIKTYCNVLT